jgi:hypothetical protein
MAKRGRPKGRKNRPSEAQVSALEELEERGAFVYEEGVEIDLHDCLGVRRRTVTSLLKRGDIIRTEYKVLTFPLSPDGHLVSDLSVFHLKEQDVKSAVQKFLTMILTSRINRLNWDIQRNIDAIAGIHHSTEAWLEEKTPE